MKILLCFPHGLSKPPDDIAEYQTLCIEKSFRVWLKIQKLSLFSHEEAIACSSVIPYSLSYAHVGSTVVWGVGSSAPLAAGQRDSHSVCWLLSGRTAWVLEPVGLRLCPGYWSTILFWPLSEGIFSSGWGGGESLKSSKMKFRSYSSCQVNRVVSWDTWLYLDSLRMHRRFWWLIGLSLIVSMEKGVCLCSSLSREKSFTFFVTLLTEFHSQNLRSLFWSWQYSVLWWERI